MTYPASYGLNQQIRRVLYALKRQYGGSIVVYQNGVVTADAKTGEVARTKTATRIQRAVILPVKISAEVKHTVAMISANKQMLTGAGGGFESGQRLFIIERRDCPNLVLHKTDWVATTAASTPLRTTKSTSSMRRTSSPARNWWASPSAWPGRLSISRPATRWPWTLRPERGAKPCRPIPIGHAGCSHP